jgi:peptidoglycan-associated lipoprotein
MSKKMTRMFVLLSAMVLFAGGCANKDVIKKEEPVVSAAETRTEPVQSGQNTSNTDTPASLTDNKRQEFLGQLETVYFNFDKSDLHESSRKVLAKNAELLLKNKETRFRIEGHADERGSAEYNLALGQRRATSVSNYLVTLGVPADQLSIISFGKEKPAVTGSNEDAWAKNRRADFTPIK